MSHYETLATNTFKEAEPLAESETAEARQAYHTLMARAYMYQAMHMQATQPPEDAPHGDLVEELLGSPASCEQKCKFALHAAAVKTGDLTLAEFRLLCSNMQVAVLPAEVKQRAQEYLETQ